MVEAGWVAVGRRRRSKAETLSALLGDGRWHPHQEMVKAGGTRFGARLFELHRDDERPLHYRRQLSEPDCYLYRQCEEDECDECQHPRESFKAKYLALEAENARLRSRIEDFESF